MRPSSFFILAFFAAAPCFGEGRVKMSDNSADTSVKDTIKSLVDSFDSENLDSYSSCFKESVRPRIRRKAAMMFADDDCNMGLVDAHVIELGEESASVAVKYHMGGSSCSYEYLSEVFLVKEGGRWVVERESVRSSKCKSVASAGVQSASAKPAGKWDPFKPDRNKIPENLHHLIGDIGIQEGMGCAGGRCANGRCELR